MFCESQLLKLSGGIAMKRLIAVIQILAMLIFIGCTSQSMVNATNSEPSIVRYPPADDYTRGKIEELPSYDENLNRGWQVDVRSTDLSSLDLSDRLYDLLHADFDSSTIWPHKLPLDFDPDKIAEMGKDPGLNVKALHKEGITGKGVSIAIIDQTLLVDHAEYADRVRFYEEINISEDEPAQMHGPAVASIALGKTVGVAPEAELYYIAETHGTFNNGAFESDFTYLAQSIDRILEINRDLPQDKKIRVISISAGWLPEDKGYNEVVEAVERAKEEGIFVVSSVLERTYGFRFLGLGRNVLKNPNDFESYGPGSWWEDHYFLNESNYKNMLFVPMDSRATAGPTGINDYAFYYQGGLSWSIPYVAGLYALSCQVNPDITPDIFWKEALETGVTIDIEKEGEVYHFGKIADPVKLINKIKIK